VNRTNEPSSLSPDESPVDRSLAHLTRTKIIATLGPASASPDMLRALIREGVDVFRLNLAHGTLEDHTRALADIRRIEEEVANPVAVLVDLAGPKIRLGTLASDPLDLPTGAAVRVVRGTETTDAATLVTSYPLLVDEAAVGDELVLGDGLVRLVVTARTPSALVCRVAQGGQVRSRQGIALPGAKLSATALTPRDREHISWAAAHGADYISLSFVRHAEDVLELKRALAALNNSALVIAKIERREALDELDAIINAADGVMVARGDLGVEIAIEKTPLAQKRIVTRCLQLGKPVIVATQMLESMHHSRQPTRAEASDVANAILDGADACMLSGETAIGDYPRESVAMMRKIMFEAEHLLRDRPSLLASIEPVDRRAGTWAALAAGAAVVAQRIAARMVVIATSHGRAALAKSQQRDFIPTVAVTDDRHTVRRMCLWWGIKPVELATAKLCRLPAALFETWPRGQAGVRDDDRVVLVIESGVGGAVTDSLTVTTAAAAQ